MKRWAGSGIRGVGGSCRRGSIERTREAPLALRAARGTSEQFLAAAYFASAVGEERAVRMRTAAIPHDVASAVGEERAVRMLQALRHRKLRLKTAETNIMDHLRNCCRHP